MEYIRFLFFSAKVCFVNVDLLCKSQINLKYMFNYEQCPKSSLGIYYIFGVVKEGRLMGPPAGSLLFAVKIILIFPNLRGCLFFAVCYSSCVRVFL